MTENHTAVEITSERDVNNESKSYINWDEYFMATAFLSAKRSKDPSTKVGACIVNSEKKIVGIGYNGMPTGCDDTKFPWTKSSSNPLETKFFYVCHAELNAILNKNSSDVKNCTIYVGLFPCNECAKVIIQSGIKTVIYMSDKHAHKVETIAAKKMFDAAGVEYRYFNCLDNVYLIVSFNKCLKSVMLAYRQYIPKTQKIVIDFTEINWNEMTQLPPTPMKTDI